MIPLGDQIFLRNLRSLQPAADHEVEAVAGAVAARQQERQRWADADELPTSKHIWADLSEAHLDAEQRDGLLTLLESIHPLRLRLRGPLSDFFEELLPKLVDAVLSGLEPDRQ